jgi:hypothetical protein
MRNAAWRAMAGVKRVTVLENPEAVKVSRKDIVAIQRDIDEEVKAKDIISDVLDMQIKCVSLLHDLGGLDLNHIDRLFGMKQGTSTRLKRKYPTYWRDHTLRHGDAAIALFYRSKISIVEHLMTAAPNTIKFLRELQAMEGVSVDVRFQAGKEIREWTSLFFRNRQSQAARDLLDPKMKEAASEADALDELLGRMMEKQLGDGEEN